MFDNYSHRKWGILGVIVVSMETINLEISLKEVPHIVVERSLNIFNSKYIFLFKFFVPFYMILFL